MATIRHPVDRLTDHKEFWFILSVLLASAVVAGIVGFFWGNANGYANGIQVNLGGDNNPPPPISTTATPPVTTTSTTTTTLTTTPTTTVITTTPPVTTSPTPTTTPPTTTTSTPPTTTTTNPVGTLPIGGTTTLPPDTIPDIQREYPYVAKLDPSLVGKLEVRYKVTVGSRNGNVQVSAEWIVINLSDQKIKGMDFIDTVLVKDRVLSGPDPSKVDFGSRPLEAGKTVKWGSGVSFSPSLLGQNDQKDVSYQVSITNVWFAP